MDLKQEIDFVVGEEKRLVDVLEEGQVMPLLKGALKAGILLAAIVDDRDVLLWAGGDVGHAPATGAAAWDVSHSLFLEGEPVGAVRLMKGRVNDRGSRILVEMIGGALNSMMANNLKRMLTTEIHTKVVNQSYEELLESHQRLAESEKKYRDLAENLEIRVQERTEELKRAYAGLIQQEKMASIGQLAAGVAHEINNPLGFILSNFNTLKKYLDRIVSMLEYYQGLGDAAGAEKWGELKLDFVLEDIRDLLEQNVSGAERVKKIVSDLKGFSHVDEVGEGKVDVNGEIDRTLNVLGHEIPRDARIVREYGQLPAFTGKGVLLGQVFLNLLRNAFQARPDGLELAITTEHEMGSVLIRIADNGPGVAEDILGRIFEPFFTTRDVGQGVGLGLTVTYDIVTGLGGTIEVNNRKEGGASFLIRLPIGPFSPTGS